MSELFEISELHEMSTDSAEYKMYEHQFEELLAGYEQALAGGFEDIVKTYKEKLEELKEKLKKKDVPATAVTGHQAAAGDLTFEGKLGAHQGYASGEISFGSSDIKTLEARADKWLKDVEFHESQLESSVKMGKDTAKNMSDLKSAKEQYETAIRDLQWARKHQ